jgi:hypothetical protein
VTAKPPERVTQYWRKYVGGWSHGVGDSEPVDYILASVHERVVAQVHDQANELVRVDADNARLLAEFANLRTAAADELGDRDETIAALRAQLAAVTERDWEADAKWLMKHARMMGSRMDWLIESARALRERFGSKTCPRDEVST